MPRPYILAIDPGQISGAAWIARADLASFDSIQLAFPAICRMIKTYTEAWRTTLDVVAERFTIGPKTYRRLGAEWPLQVIGIARFYSMEHTGQDLIMYEQNPPFASDQRLKALGWWRPGQEDANSAARQVLKHMAETDQGFKNYVGELGVSSVKPG
jgi:hypothetical protein